MCLVKIDKDDDPPSPPRRIVIRPASYGSDRIITSRPVSHAHSHRSSRHISAAVIEPAPRPSQYVLAPSTSVPARISIPQIIHGSSPPRSREHLNVIRLSTDGSPRGSRTSVASRHSSHSRHGSRGRADGEVVYVERRISARGERPRSAQFLVVGSSRGDREVIDSYGTVETPRQTLFLEDGGLRTRSRSITYGTTGPRISRERVLVEEGGRRRESYRPLGSS